MQNIIIDKPYVPVPPHRGRIWPAILNAYLPRYLRKKYRVLRVESAGVGHLTDSLSAGHGIIPAANHCRDEDPLVLGMLCRQARTPFFIMASWHAFMQDKFHRFLLRRAGAFSVYREGIDRTAINTAVEILHQAKRPLIIFPEGFISRTNDQINDLLDGVALIARMAARKRAKLDKPGTPGASAAPGKVVVHPVAIRYQFLGNVETAVAPVLDEIESRLTWRPQPGLPLLDRIARTGKALLSLKEIEYLGQAGDGDIGPRLQRLMDAILIPLEKRWLDGPQSDAVPVRVKRLRSAILPDLTTGELDETQRQERWLQLADLYLAQSLSRYPPDYVAAHATPMRLLETVERFEEDLTDRVRVHGPMSATITVGPAIEASPTRDSRTPGSDPLLDAIESQLRSMLQLGTS